MKTRLLVITLILVLVAAVPCLSVEMRSGNNVTIPEGTTIDDDLYAFASKVDVAGSVRGDILAAAGDVTVTGNAAQDITVTGGNITVSGRTGDDLLAMGGTIRASGVVAQNATVAGGDVVFANTSRVVRDLQVAGGTVVIDGTVGRDLNVAAGEATVNGTVGRNLTFNGDRLRIGPNAVIRGDLTYTSPNQVQVAEGARILGETTRRPVPERRGPSLLALMLYWLLTYLMILVVGLIFTALTPRFTMAVADRLMTSPWISLLIGFLILIAAPALILAIALTIIGLPLAGILLAVYLISVYISRIYVGMLVGRMVFRGRPETSPYLMLAVGLLLLWIVFAIPIIGWLAHLLAIFFGLGALAYERFVVARDLRTEGRL